MSDSCNCNASCVHQCCPEAPAISFSQTLVQINGSQVLFKDEYFGFNDSVLTDGRTFELAAYPYQAESVQVFLNSGNQRQGIDFVIFGQQLKLINPIVSGDQIHVHYLSWSGENLVGSVAAIGEIISWGGNQALAPTGFLLCNGAAYSRTVYSNLFATIGTEYGAGDGSTTFNVPTMRTTFYDGTTLVDRISIIKY